VFSLWLFLGRFGDLGWFWLLDCFCVWLLLLGFLQNWVAASASSPFWITELPIFHEAQPAGALAEF
jgi:hypothetical protein